MRREFTKLVHAAQDAREPLMQHRRENGGPMHYIPQPVNAELNALAGYPGVGALVVCAEGGFMFHRRPENPNDPWSGMYEWPDMQATSVPWPQIRGFLASTGIPEHYLDNQPSTVGTHIVWEKEEPGRPAAYCYTERLKFSLSPDQLPKDWQKFSVEKVQQLASAFDGNSGPGDIVPYHLAAALWYLDPKRFPTRAPLRPYLQALPKGPLDD